MRRKRLGHNDAWPHRFFLRQRINHWCDQCARHEFACRHCRQGTLTPFRQNGIRPTPRHPVQRVGGGSLTFANLTCCVVSSSSFLCFARHNFLFPCKLVFSSCFLLLSASTSVLFLRKRRGEECRTGFPCTPSFFLCLQCIFEERRKRERRKWSVKSIVNRCFPARNRTGEAVH